MVEPVSGERMLPARRAPQTGRARSWGHPPALGLLPGADTGRDSGPPHFPQEHRRGCRRLPGLCREGGPSRLALTPPSRLQG